MFVKRTVISQIEVREDGQIQVRATTIVSENGVDLGGETYHRHVVHPGQKLEREDTRVRAIAQVVHTPSVIAAYQAAHKD